MEAFLEAGSWAKSVSENINRTSKRTIQTGYIKIYIQGLSPHSATRSIVVTPYANLSSSKSASSWWWRGDFPRKALHFTFSLPVGGSAARVPPGVLPRPILITEPGYIDTFFPRGGSVRYHRASAPSCFCCPVTLRSTLAPATHALPVGGITPGAAAPWGVQSVGGGSALLYVAPASQTRDNTRRAGAVRAAARPTQQLGGLPPLVPPNLPRRPADLGRQSTGPQQGSLLPLRDGNSRRARQPRVPSHRPHNPQQRAAHPPPEQIERLMSYSGMRTVLLIRRWSSKTSSSAAIFT